MSKNRRNRCKTHQANGRRDGHGHVSSVTPKYPVCPETGLTDTTKIRMLPDAAPEPTAASAGGDSPSGSNYDASAGNSLRHGRRAKTIYPEEMAAMVDDRFRQFVAEQSPQSSLQTWVVYELARSTVQEDASRNLLLRDLRRVLDRANSDLAWAAFAEERVDRLAARLTKDPYTVARALERTKQGAAFLLYNYKFIAAAIKESGGLNDVQRQLLFDLRGVPHALRTGTGEVPAGTDGPGLTALIAREQRRLQLKHDTELTASDKLDQISAQNCMFKYHDSITRGIKSDASRAHHRVEWALATLKELKAGADPATLIDYETKAPLDPAARAPAATRSKPAPAASAAAPPPPPPPPPPPNEADPGPAPPAFRMPPMPEGCSGDAKAMFAVIAEAHHRAFAPSGPTPLPTDDLPDHPGPPSA